MKRDMPLIMLCLGLLTGTGVLWLAADRIYAGRINDSVLRENRFLTTEWQLLKELKDQTDRLLRDKDRLIGELRARYLASLKGNAPLEFLAELERELARAEAERSEILSARLSGLPLPAVLSDAAGGGSLGSPSPDDVEDPLLEELGRHVARLENELREKALESAEYASELETVRRENASLRSAALRAAESAASEVSPAESASSEAEAAEPSLEEVRTLLENERAALASARSPALSDLKTRVLLRAIVRTPAIRGEYPELPEAVDRYFALYGEAERLEGKREAYAAALSGIKSLTDH